jgi:hypothetical protein
MLEGEVGIEVELEGEGLPTNIAKGKFSKAFWNIEGDGSLRGPSAEYVLRSPIPRGSVNEALTQLYSKLQYDSLLDSGRAGVHIHINVRDLNLPQLYSFILLYLVFENVLVKYCGEDREGNLFCLRASDAEYLLFMVHKLLRRHRLNEIGGDVVRYSSINLSAIRKYGSLEFRAMRSPVAADVIETWAKLLLCLKDAALRYNSPREIVQGVSELGGYDFAHSIFGDLVEHLDSDNWGVDVMKGMRLIQPLTMAYDEAALSGLDKKAGNSIPIPPTAPIFANWVGTRQDWAQVAEVSRQIQTRLRP